MNMYTLALFFHVVGAIGFFASISVWLFGLAALRRASRVEQVRAITGMIALSDPVAVVSILLIAGAGLYMAFTTWDLGSAQSGWIAVAIVSFVLMAPIGPLVAESRLHTLTALAREAPDGPLPAALAARTRDPIMGTALQTLIALLLGIVFLMTTKPAFTSSIVTMTVALVLGLVSGVPLWRRAVRAGRD